MRNIIKFLSIAAVAAAAFLQTGCQKFEPTPPYEPVEMTPTMTIAQFKALYRGVPIQIMDENIIIAGKVTSTDRTGNVYRSLYIEDETAGLEVKIGKTGLYNDYKRGQMIYIKPQYLALGAYGESVQLGAVSNQEKYETSYIDAQALINRTIFRGPIGDTVVPAVITEDYQINESMVCRLVELKDASYAGTPDGIKTWAVKADKANGIEAQYGQHKFKIDGREVVVRTSGYAAFANVEVGMDLGQKCNLTGILTKFRDTYQLVLLGLEGVERL